MPHLLMPRPVPTFQDELVTLRPPDLAEDAEDYFQMNLDPAMRTWTGKRVFDGVDSARAERMRCMAMRDLSTWMIVDNPNYAITRAQWTEQSEVLEQECPPQLAADWIARAGPHTQKPKPKQSF